MRRLASSRRGAAAVELALAAPLLGMLMLGFADMVQLVRSHIRVNSAAEQIGKIVSQCKKVSGGDEKRLVSLTRSILGSFADSGDWALVVHASGLDANGDPISWRMPAAGLPAIAAKPKGSELPPNLDLKKNEVVFSTEVFSRVKTNFLSRNSVAHEVSVNMTRAPNVADLKGQNAADGAEDCLRRTY